MSRSDVPTSQTMHTNDEERKKRHIVHLHNLLDPFWISRLVKRHHSAKDCRHEGNCLSDEDFINEIELLLAYQRQTLITEIEAKAPKDLEYRWPRLAKIASIHNYSSDDKLQIVNANNAAWRDALHQLTDAPEKEQS